MSNDKKKRKIIIIIAIVLVFINILAFSILFLDLSKIKLKKNKPVEEESGYQLSEDGTIFIDGITYKKKEDGNFIVLSVEKTIVNADIKNKIDENDVGNVDEIAEKAFENCTELESLNIPTTITKINSYAFSGCKKLNIVTIPYSVTEIGDSIFYECSNLSSIRVAVSNQKFMHYNGVLYDIDGKRLYAYPYKKEDESYKLADSLESIENNAFRGFEKLKSVALPENLKNIGNGAFENCKNLSSVTMTKSVTSIGKNAFSGCSNNLVIRSEKGSYAETYAKENNFKFEEVVFEKNIQTENKTENVTQNNIIEIQ